MKKNRQHSIFPFLPLTFELYGEFVISDDDQREGSKMFYSVVLKFLSGLEMVTTSNLLDEFAS